MKRFTACTLAIFLTTALHGQSFNIDIGSPGAAPPSSYAAAGQPGFWLSLPATQGVTALNLRAVDGTITDVYMTQIGGTETLLVSDPALSGDDATLMNDFLITHTVIENCLFFHQMDPGEYEVLIYARMPAQPDVLAQTNVDQEPGSPDELVGGRWPGQHQENITYSRHTAFVADSGPAAGKLGLHAGVAPGGSFAVGAVMNAVQIRKIVAVTGDTNGDGFVNVDDLLAVINGWGPCPTPPAGCPADVAPEGGNGQVDVDDLLSVINNWG